LRRGLLHVLSDRLHKRALVGNSHVGHTEPQLSRPLHSDMLTPNTSKPPQ
jgi:hypothetical protein